MSNNKIHKILFVCHGNICRSPMAEFVMKHIVRQAGLVDKFEIASAATSTEEIGNDVYPPVKQILYQEGIPCRGHHARQITEDDYCHFDYIVVMDSMNIRNLQRLLGSDIVKVSDSVHTSENSGEANEADNSTCKVTRLLDHTPTPGDIADPWYTRDFALTYRQVTEGCKALLDKMG